MGKKQANADIVNGIFGIKQPGRVVPVKKWCELKKAGRNVALQF